MTDLSGALFAYDLATGAHDSSKDITTLADAGNHNANGLWSDGTTMWVSDPKNNIKIFAYDLATGEMDTSKELTTLCSIWSLDPRASDNCHPAGLWSDGTTMWVLDHHKGRIYSYNMPAEGEEQ